jgi:DNA-binding LacI/PurR family transcriptional regulator
MAKFNLIAKELQRELLDGTYGEPNDPFMTVRDLAARFGVSLATAQKVVKELKNNQFLQSVTPTSPAVIHPNLIGRIAPFNRPNSGRLGIVIPNSVNPFFGRLSRFVQESALQRGFEGLVAETGESFEREARAIESFLEIGVGGLLICPGLDEASRQLYQSLVEREIPLTLMARRVEGVSADCVFVHNFVGAASMAGHFLTMGYESFGYIGIGPRLRRDMRLQGFRSALMEEEIELSGEGIVDADGRDIEDGFRAMAQLMERKSRPRAIFAYNDLLAIGALQYCQENGIGTPDEVAIAGFDNLPESRVTSPGLTTIDYPVEMLARLSVQNVIDRIEHPDRRPGNRILLEPRLVVRGSTDPTALQLREAYLPPSSENKATA